MQDRRFKYPLKVSFKISTFVFLYVMLFLPSQLYVRLSHLYMTRFLVVETLYARIYSVRGAVLMEVSNDSFILKWPVKVIILNLN